MMGTDIQRTILLVFFGFSLFLLWNNWQVYNGKPPMFGAAPAPKAVTPPAAAPSAVGSGRGPGPGADAPGVNAARSTPPAAVDATPGALTSKPVVIQTDLVRASIDPVGAVVSRVELLNSQWRPTGLRVD